MLILLLAATGLGGVRPPYARVLYTGAADTASTSARTSVDYFPIGVFEDGNVMNQAAQFEAMINDVQSHGLDSIMFTNNFVSRDAPLLSVSDRLGASVYMMPSGDLNSNWWPASVPADIMVAGSVARPIVEQFGPHPSFKGYIVKDEPALGDLDKVALLTQAFQELDPARPAMPILIGVDRVRPIFAAAQPDVMLIDVYPTGYSNPPCDFTLTGFGYSDLDFVSYTRLVAGDRPATTPLWMILQTHSFMDSLREPAATEVRMQHWLAIGEGATGIFWFIYSSQQGWTGLKDNPALFDEVGALARRTLPLRSLLLGLHKVEDHFTIEGSQNPYISTLASPDRTRYYAVAVNRDCQHQQQVVIKGLPLEGALRDVETSQIYAMGTPVTLQPGDGRIFQLVWVQHVPIVMR